MRTRHKIGRLINGFNAKSMTSRFQTAYDNDIEETVLGCSSVDSR
jgi:hypothetical protein